MKRFIFVLLAVLTAFTFTACNKKEKVVRIDTVHFVCGFVKEYDRYVHAIVSPDIDVDELVIECESFDLDGNIIDTFTLEVGRVKKNKHYRIVITGWSETYANTFVADMKISDAWGIIKK